MKTVIGLVGPIASGKGVVARILESRGFSRYILSDVIRAEIASREQFDLIDDRQTLQDVGNELRQEHGPEVLAYLTGLSIEEDPNRLIVLDGIRNPGEVKFLKQKYGAIIIGIDADLEMRKKRYLNRSKIGDPKTEEEFSVLERRDRGEGEEEYGQRVSDSLALADVIIKNNWEDLEPLQEAIKEKLLWFGIEKPKNKKEH